MKKRFIATLLTTAMVASMLSACGDSGTSNPTGAQSVPTDTTAATESAASDSSGDVVHLAQVAVDLIGADGVILVAPAGIYLKGHRCHYRMVYGLHQGSGRSRA